MPCPRVLPEVDTREVEPIYDLVLPVPPTPIINAIAKEDRGPVTNAVLSIVIHAATER